MSTSTVAPPARRPLRADAARNRVRILQAAREVFADRGLDVTLDDIAKQAGLGVGTVYRRFADREALVEALFTERMQVVIERARAAVDAPDAWSALVSLLEEICQDMSRDRGLHQVMLSSEYGQDRVARHREELVPLISALVGRAQAEGTLREGFSAEDIPPMLVMVSAVADFARGVSPDLWRRYFTMLVDGLRARPGQQALQACGALGADELASATCGYRVRRR